MPNFNGKGAPGFTQGLKGLADMMAANLRGATAATAGLPGDIESMGRMGINAMGGQVSPQSYLPTTKDMQGKLPPLNPLTGQDFSVSEDTGQFLPINVVGPIVGAAGKAKIAVQALRQSAPTAATDMGRRTALKSLGAAGAGAAMAPELVVQALRNVPATPVAGKAAVAKVASKGLSAATRSALGKVINDSWGMLSAGPNKINVDDALRLAKMVAGDLPEEKLAEGMERLAGLNGQGRFLERTLPEDGLLKQADLDKLGYDDYEKIQEAVFRGELNARDLDIDVLYGMGYNRSPGNWSMLSDSLSGHDEKPLLDKFFKPKE